MKTAQGFVMALVLAASFPAMAQFNPFQTSKRYGPQLSDEDLSRLFASVARLNAETPIGIGASQGWNNPATGSRGTSTVTGILDSGGLACHVLHHEIEVQGRAPPRQYDFTWCRAADGTWKIKS